MLKPSGGFLKKIFSPKTAMKPFKAMGKAMAPKRVMGAMNAPAKKVGGFFGRAKERAASKLSAPSPAPSTASESPRAMGRMRGKAMERSY